MSPSKLNSLLTRVFVAMCFVAMYIAVSGSVMAQDGLRLWKPYDPQLFSGGRRSNDGMYSSLSGIYWSISAPKGGYIGATTTNGEDDTRMVVNLSAPNETTWRAQTNSLKINMMNSTETLGVRFEVGNRRGHHGWLVSGYGLPSQSHMMSTSNVSMAIRDEGRFAYYDSVADSTKQDAGYLWKVITSGTAVELQWRAVGVSHGLPGEAGWAMEMAEDDSELIPTLPDTPAGYRYYEIVPAGKAYFVPVVDTTTGAGVFGPSPVVFDTFNVRVRSQHQSVEAMYTYRAHPFTWGSMELLAGARYWDFEDKFWLNGTNNRYAAGISTVIGGGIRAFRQMSVDAKAQNRVVGPQVGMKLSRQNTRWTFGAEGRLTAGINPQRVKTSGRLLPFDQLSSQTILGARYAATDFAHSQTKTYFSPIAEFRLSAEWQWTSAVSFFGAADAMWAGNIARGVRVTDYVVHSTDGAIFGIRGNDRNTSIAVYGVEAGIKVNR